MREPKRKFVREFRGEPRHELGTGVLNWASGYSFIHLLSAPGNSNEVPLVKAKQGNRGWLVAVVQATRKSEHPGDPTYGAKPRTPEVGEVIVLGEGVLYFYNNYAGLLPDDPLGQTFDIPNLFRVHDQTVTLAFEYHPYISTRHLSPPPRRATRVLRAA